MHPLLESAFARVPGLYARLVGLRRRPNIEKIAFLRLLHRGDTVLDIGANAGYYTLLFSHLAGPRGHVHAFEPIPPTFALLSSHITHGRRFDNAVLNNCAVSDAADAAGGPLTLFVPGADFGQASLARHHNAGSWQREEPVRSWPATAVTLDSYCAALPRLDFIKCDVEGAELKVLRGAAATLRRFTPLLSLEVCADWTEGFGYEPADLVRFLAPFGYSRFYLAGETLRPLGVAADAAEAELAAGGLPGSASLLCAVPERHGERLAKLRPWLSAPSERTA
jgi:FkbM family methyltransferase